MRIQPHRWLGTVAAAVAAVAATAAALPARPLVAATVNTAPAGGQLGDVAGVHGLGRRGSDNSPLRDLVLSERISADDVPGAYEVSGDQSTLCPRLLYIGYHDIREEFPHVFDASMEYSGPHLNGQDEDTCYTKATWFVPSDRLDDTAALVGAGVPSSFQGYLNSSVAARAVLEALRLRDIRSLIGFEGLERKCGLQLYPADTMWFFFRTGASPVSFELEHSGFGPKRRWSVLPDTSAVAIASTTDMCVMEVSPPPSASPSPTVSPARSPTPSPLPSPPPPPSPTHAPSVGRNPPGASAAGASGDGSGRSRVVAIAVGLTVGLTAGLLVVAAVGIGIHRAGKARHASAQQEVATDDSGRDGNVEGESNEGCNDDDSRGGNDGACEDGGSGGGASRSPGDVSEAAPAAEQWGGSEPLSPTAPAEVVGCGHGAPLPPPPAAAAVEPLWAAATTAVAAPPFAPPPSLPLVETGGWSVGVEGSMGDTAPLLPPELLGSWAPGVLAAPPYPRHPAVGHGDGAAGGVAPIVAEDKLPPMAMGVPLNRTSSFSDDVNVDALFEE